MLITSEIFLRGRRRAAISAFPYSQVRQAAGLMLLLLLLLFIVRQAVKVGERAGAGPVSVAAGEARVEPDFARTRGHIGYLVAGSGSRYYYAEIAKRFEVRGGWKSVARLTLEAEAKKATASNVEASQYNLSAGKEVRVPISDALQSK